MFNLLPKAEKKSIRREYRARLAVVWLWFFLATLLIAAALLLPSYVLSVQKEDATERLALAFGKGSPRRESASLGAVLQTAQGKLELVNNTSAIYLFERIAEVVRKKSAGISLSGFSVAAVTDGKRAFFISGVASERGALVSFAEILKKAGLFEKVEVPLSLFAKERDIEFTIRAAGAF